IAVASRSGDTAFLAVNNPAKPATRGAVARLPQHGAMSTIREVSDAAKQLVWGKTSLRDHPDSGRGSLGRSAGSGPAGNHVYCGGEGRHENMGRRRHH